MSRPFFLLPGICTVVLSGCTNHSPTIDVVGSYFPAWLACIFAGLTLSTICRQFLIGLGVHEFLPVRTLFYLGLGLLFTLLAWLLFYRG